MDWTDRNTCVLFGDAAGAMVLAPERRANRGLLSTHLHTDGTQRGDPLHSRRRFAHPGHRGDAPAEGCTSSR